MVENVREDMLSQRAINVILYPVRPAHGIPNQLLDCLPGHYLLALGDTREESDEYQ